MTTKPIPEGFHTVTPFLAVEGADLLIDFLKRAFGALELHRLAWPDGAVAHAEVLIGDSVVMIGETRGETKPTSASLYLYVQDVDSAYHQALEAGGVSLMEPTDQFYGDRNGGVADPYGNQWWIATHIEDVSVEELDKRAQEWMLQQEQAA